MSDQTGRVYSAETLFLVQVLNHLEALGFRRANPCQERAAHGGLTVKGLGGEKPVDDDDPVVLGGQVDQSAGFEVLDHAAVAMQEH